MDVWSVESSPFVADSFVSNQPLLIGDHLVQVDRDPQVLADRLAQHYNVLDFGVKPGCEADFLHRTSTSTIGQLMVSFGITTPVMGTIGASENRASVNLLFSGAVTYGGDKREFLVNAKQPFFFAPAQDYSYLVDDHYNGLVFDLDLIRLRKVAAAMAGLGVSERRFASDFETMRAIQPATPAVEEMIQMLVQCFRLMDQQELRSLGYLQHLQVDDLIYRNLALLLSPRLRQILNADSAERSGRERVLTELLEWIQAHLQTPISLSDLELVTGYSRRNLQQAFQQRFGCGPIQWVRRQRMERIRQELLSAEANETVADIASRYGFTSLSVFSRDFRALYGLRPSDLLREGRRPSP